LFGKGEGSSGLAAAFKEFFSNKTPFSENIAEQANAAIERKVFQTSEGKVIELHRQPKDVVVSMPSKDGPIPREIKKGTEIYEWKDGKKTLVGHSPDLEFGLGDSVKLKDGTEVKIVDGKVPLIEKHSPYRYLHDAEASARLANIGLRKMARDLELVNNLKKSELFKEVGRSPETPLKDLPKGFKQPTDIDKIPQLRGWYFDPKSAAIIEDFAKIWDNTMVMKLTNQLVKNMMLNPLPHMFNEVMHLWNARGLSGWVPGTGGLSRLAESGKQAWRDVGMQTPFYREIMREGGSILGADPRNTHFEPLFDFQKKALENNAGVTKSMTGLAKALGTTTLNLYNGLSRKSQQAMWFSRDVMYVQYVRELQAIGEKRTGIKPTVAEAVKEAERHMPNYRLPSEVLGSRTVSKVLQNPNVSLFSRYHYGMVKSLVETVKELNPKHLGTKEGRAEFRNGVDTLLAIGVAMSVLYPLADKLAQSVFGEDAEQRRAGPYHLLKAVQDMAEGNKDLSALVWPVFTFNPILLGLGQLAVNKQMFSGKPVYHPEDPIGDIAGDVGKYLAKQVPQVQTGIRAQEEDFMEGAVAKQFDIKVQSEAARERARKAKVMRDRNQKTRSKQRDKGSYRG
jgi:hypothetical protein